MGNAQFSSTSRNWLCIGRACHVFPEKKLCRLRGDPFRWSMSFGWSVVVWWCWCWCFCGCGGENNKRNSLSFHYSLFNDSYWWSREWVLFAARRWQLKNDTPAASSYRQSMKIHWLSWGIWYSSIDYDAVIYLEMSEVSFNQKIPDIVWVYIWRLVKYSIDSVLGLSPFEQLPLGWHGIFRFPDPTLSHLEAGAWVENPTMFSNEYAADMVWRLKKEPRETGQNRPEIYLAIFFGGGLKRSFCLFLRRLLFCYTIWNDLQIYWNIKNQLVHNYILVV